MLVSTDFFLLILFLSKAAGIFHDKKGNVSQCLLQRIFQAFFKAPVDSKLCDFHCGYLRKLKRYIYAPQVSALTPCIAKLKLFLGVIQKHFCFVVQKPLKLIPKKKAGRNPVQLFLGKGRKELTWKFRYMPLKEQNRPRLKSVAGLQFSSWRCIYSALLSEYARGHIYFPD